MQIHPKTEIRRRSQLHAAEITLPDLELRQNLEATGGALPDRYRRHLERWRFGTTASKLDYLLDAPMHWGDERAAHAGTGHVGGNAEWIIEAERRAWLSEIPRRPFVMVVQPSSVGRSRAPQGNTL
ncbi:hypothetical protein [Glutamicibacter sp. NPDC087344]|uniref:hypothetical protein n=1 Tax=Glutamicibacter sp. NPDC087344 TaxID=3363994 RepID=UPI00380E33F9